MALIYIVNRTMIGFDEEKLDKSGINYVIQYARAWPPREWRRQFQETSF